MQMSDHSTIGKTVVEYTENSRHIACLSKQLSDIGEHLVALGEMLRDDPSPVNVTTTHIQMVDHGGFTVGPTPTKAIPVAALDQDALVLVLKELIKAKTSHDRLSAALKGMGLEELTRVGRANR